MQQLQARFGRTLLSGLSLVIGILSIIAIQVTSVVAVDTLVRITELQQGRTGSAVAQLSYTPATRQVATRMVTLGYPGQAVLTIKESGLLVRSSAGTPFYSTISSGDLRLAYPMRLSAQSSAQAEDGLVWVNRVGAAALGDNRVLYVRDAHDSIDYAVTVGAVVDDGSDLANAYIPESRVGTLDSGAQMEIRLAPAHDGLAVDTSTLSESLEGAGLKADVIRVVDVRSNIARTASVFKLGFLVAAIVTLAVGILSTLNIGLATLTERAEELALRRSVGARKGEVFVLVMLDSLIIGILGSVVAIVLSWTSYLFVMQLIVGGVERPPFPVSAWLVGVAAGLVAGSLGGVAPAIKAVSTPISSVMRA